MVIAINSDSRTIINQGSRGGLLKSSTSRILNGLNDVLMTMFAHHLTGHTRTIENLTCLVGENKLTLDFKNLTKLGNFNTDTLFPNVRNRVILTGANTRHLADSTNTGNVLIVRAGSFHFSNEIFDTVHCIFISRKQFTRNEFLRDIRENRMTNSLSYLTRVVHISLRVFTQSSLIEQFTDRNLTRLEIRVSHHLIDEPLAKNRSGSLNVARLVKLRFHQFFYFTHFINLSINYY